METNHQEQMKFRINDFVSNDPVLMELYMEEARRILGRDIDNSSDDDPEFYSVISILIMKALMASAQDQVYYE